MFIDHVGEKHGFLLIQEYSGKNSWICLCDCGRKTEKSYNSLLQYIRNGTVASCGCFNNRRKLNLIGKRFGRLVVKDKSNIGWLCLCDCGQQTVIKRSYNLQSRNTTSCGCLKHNFSQPPTILEDRIILYSNKDQIPFFIDVADYESVSRYSWRIDNYPITNIRINEKDYCIGYKNLRLHEFLLGKAPDKFWWDHINRNKLDNRRNNIRLSTPSENIRNTDLRKNNTSGVRGVYRSGNGWVAKISDKPNHILELGYFSTFDEAIAVRRNAEIQYYEELCI
jgi:hypothetical protein